jgi:hypothetical protein
MACLPVSPRAQKRYSIWLKNYLIEVAAKLGILLIQCKSLQLIIYFNLQHTAKPLLRPLQQILHY